MLENVFFPLFIQSFAGCKGKNQVTFFMTSFKNNVFQESYWLFALFPKLKRRLELIFAADFLHIFSIKMFLIK